MLGQDQYGHNLQRVTEARMGSEEGKSGSRLRRPHQHRHAVNSMFGDGISISASSR